MTEAITLQESARLVELEDVIERGLKNFIAVGEALLEIRDSRLYKADYNTFEDYCRDEWEMSKTQANRLIGGSVIAAALAPIGVTPTKESQARPLTKLETPEQQREAWQVAVEASDGKPTAKHVEAAVEEIKSRVRPIPDYEPSPEVEAKIAEAEKESKTLWSLKSYWKQAGKKDRAAFLAWAKQH